MEQKAKKKTFQLSKTMSLVLIIIMIWVLFQVLSGGIFLTSRNLATLCLQTSVLGFVAVGMNMVIVLGGIDLSIPSVACLISAVGAVLNIKYDIPAIWVLLVMLGISLAIGAFHGFVVSKFVIPAFVVTLASKMYLNGLSLITTESKEYAPVDPLIRNFASIWLGRALSIVLIVLVFLLYVVITISNNRKSQKNGFDYMTPRQLLTNILPVLIIMVGICYVSFYRGLPLMAVVLAVYAFVIHTLLSNTGFGRSIYATGANAEAARLSGINTRKMVFMGFFIMGFSYFFGSWASMARISGYIPGMAASLDTDAIAACVLGGASLMGGIGTTAGALLGAFLLTSIDNGMSILNIHTFYQYIAKGLILLIAIILNSRKNKGAFRRFLKEKIRRV
ncbi:MAG: hypothetical protein E7442_03295 [Ruminococcaceae bacterium]|nr:hypothetical protein [Oscillospiraceae bacterium]